MLRSRPLPLLPSWLECLSVKSCATPFPPTPSRNWLSSRCSCPGRNSFGKACSPRQESSSSAEPLAQDALRGMRENADLWILEVTHETHIAPRRADFGLSRTLSQGIEGISGGHRGQHGVCLRPTAV